MFFVCFQKYQDARRKKSPRPARPPMELCTMGERPKGTEKTMNTMPNSRANTRYPEC